MSFHPPVTEAPRASFLELLEPRIAPAGIVIGPESREGSQYFYDQPDPPPTPFKSASAAFPSLGFSPNHYFLDLAANNKDRSSVSVVSAQGNTVDFIKLSGRSGAAYAFFYDVPDPVTGKGDGIPTVNELTGLSLAAGTSIAVKGNIDGDVVANRDAQGNLVVASLISDRQSIAAFSASSVGTNDGTNGKIIAGGSLSNITVGKVKVIQSGTPDYGAADQLTYNFGGTASPAIGTLQPFDPGARRAGGSLVTITAASVDYILAGPGGPGGVGGKISNVLVTADADGLIVRAGDGGGDVRGGAGGAVNQIVFAGTTGAVDNARLEVSAGRGGDSLSGTGGKGGAVSNVWLGYEYTDSARRSLGETVTPVVGNILVQGGQGGSGVVAGGGGAATRVNIFADTPDQPGTEFEIQLKGGNGGDLAAASLTAGAGGSVSLFKIKNLDVADNPSDVLVRGGDASAPDSVSPVPGRGAIGGSVSNPVAKAGEVWLVGASYRLEGGAGSDAQTSGGAGGSLKGLSFQAFGSLYLKDLQLLGGSGGDSGPGRGGAGGAISQIAVPAADLSRFAVTAGAGGQSAGSVGGAGGAVSTVDVYDFDPKPLREVTTLPAQIAAGAGGDGAGGGGAGGRVSGLSLFSSAASLVLSAGNGGDGVGPGRANGGSGGLISSVAFVSQSGALFLPLPGPSERASVSAGNGGSASGTGAGGSGGALSRINVEVQGEVQIAGGAGGNAQSGGRTGVGGSLGGARVDQGISATSLLRSVELAAGSAGTGEGTSIPNVGGAGGSVVNAVVSAARSILVEAGHGANGNTGGAGGSVRSIGFYGAEVDSALSGNVALLAGNGGNSASEGGRSGAGGSVIRATGFTSDAPANLEEISPNILSVKAGRGGGLAGLGIGGAGGSVDGLSLLGGYAPFHVLAGDGGDGRSGGAGGRVVNLASAAESVALSLAAGDGGDATFGRPGAGGSLNKIDVFGDIGVRLGVPYGYSEDGTKMGGIFAGRGGVAGATEGSAGSVTNITAQAISSIVAGRESSPFLAKLVDSIYLRGNEAAAERGASLPNIGQQVVSGEGSGGGARNVLGNGSELTLTGNYNTDLTVSLRTAGGIFDGVGVIYIDTDGNATGITDTRSLTAPFGPLDELTRSVAGASYQLPLLDSTRDETATLTASTAPSIVTTPQGWTFTVGGTVPSLLSSISFGLYGNTAGFAAVGVSLYVGAGTSGTPVYSTPQSIVLLDTFGSYYQLGRDLAWVLEPGRTYTIAASGVGFGPNPADPFVASTGSQPQTGDTISSVVPTTLGNTFAVSLEPPAPRLLDTTDYKTVTPLPQAAPGLSLPDGGPQGWTFTAAGPTIVEALSFGLYGDVPGLAEVGVSLYAGSSATGTPIETLAPVLVGLGTAPAYYDFSGLGWDLEEGETYTIAAYGVAITAKPFLAVSADAVETNPGAILNPTPTSAGVNFAMLMQAPSSYQSVLSFDPGFRPEYAMAFSKGEAALYDLTAETLTPVSLGAVSASASGPDSTTYTFATSLYQLGLSSKVPSNFKFAATYLAGPDLIPASLPQEVGAYRTNQSVGFAVAGANPGSAVPLGTPPPPDTPVPSYLTYVQQLANFVGGKSQDPAARDFKTSTGSFLPSPSAVAWDYGLGGTQPLDGLIAAANLSAKRNFMPLAWLTDANGGRATLWLPTLPTAA